MSQPLDLETPKDKPLVFAMDPWDEAPSQPARPVDEAPSQPARPEQTSIPKGYSQAPLEATSQTPSFDFGGMASEDEDEGEDDGEADWEPEDGDGDGGGDGDGEEAEPLLGDQLCFAETLTYDELLGEGNRGAVYRLAAEGKPVKLVGRLIVLSLKDDYTEEQYGQDLKRLEYEQNKHGHINRDGITLVPNIYSQGICESQGYVFAVLVMDYLEGITLYEMIERGVFACHRDSISKQLLKFLNHLYDKGALMNEIRSQDIYYLPTYRSWVLGDAVGSNVVLRPGPIKASKRSYYLQHKQSQYDLEDISGNHDRHRNRAEAQSRKIEDAQYAKTTFCTSRASK